MQGLRSLATLPHLQRLNCAGVRHGSESTRPAVLEQLTPLLRGLQKLVVGDSFLLCRMRDPLLGAIGVAAGSSLTHLDLTGCIEATDAGFISCLSRLPTLKHLSLQSCVKLTARVAPTLAALSQLELLNLRGCGQLHDGALAQLSTLRGLRVLNIQACPWVNGSCFAVFSALSSLAELNASSCEALVDEHVHHLAAVPCLRRIDVSSCPELCLTSLAPLTQLVELRANSCVKLRPTADATAAGMRHLAALRRLQVLEVTGVKYPSAVHAALIQAVGGMTGLRQLQLARTCPVGLSDTTITLAFVGQLQQLEQVDLSNWQAAELHSLGSAGGPLQRLTALTSLTLDRVGSAASNGSAPTSGASSPQPPPPQQQQSSTGVVGAMCRAPSLANDAAADTASALACCSSLLAAASTAANNHDAADSAASRQQADTGHTAAVDALCAPTLDVASSESRWLSEEEETLHPEPSSSAAFEPADCITLAQNALPASMAAAGGAALSAVAASAAATFTSQGSVPPGAQLLPKPSAQQQHLAFLRSFPNVVCLSLQCCSQLLDDDLIHLQHLPLLRQLNLSGCGKLVGGGLASLAAAAPQLQRLSLQDCCGLDYSALQAAGRISGLASLDLGGCQKLTDAGCASLTGLNKLTWLSFRGNRNLTAAGVSELAKLRQLKALELPLCWRLEDEALQAVASGLKLLRQLDVSFCWRLTHSAVAQLQHQLPWCKLNAQGCMLQPPSKTASDAAAAPVTAEAAAAGSQQH